MFSNIATEVNQHESNSADLAHIETNVILNFNEISGYQQTWTYTY